MVCFCRYGFGYHTCVRKPLAKGIRQKTAYARVHSCGVHVDRYRLIDEAVIENLKLPQEIVEKLHTEQDDHRYPRTEMNYRLAWARTYLKYYGLIENPEQGLWKLTPRGTQVKTVDAKEVFKCVRQQRKVAKRVREPSRAESP